MEMDIMDLGAKYVSFEEGFDFVIEGSHGRSTGRTYANFRSGNSCRYNRPQGHQYMFESWCTRKV